MFLVRLFKALFGIGHKSGYSIKGFWGQIKHFNKDNIQIGYTVKGFWGQRKRYDMEGNLKTVSWKNFWGGYNTYDAEGNLIRRTYKNLWGGYTTYDRHGRKIQESYRNFWNGFTHYDIENPDYSETYIVEKKSSYKAKVAKTSANTYTNYKEPVKKSNSGIYTDKNTSFQDKNNLNEKKKNYQKVDKQFETDKIFTAENPKKQNIKKNSETANNSKNSTEYTEQSKYDAYTGKHTSYHNENTSSFSDEKKEFNKEKQSYQNVKEHIKDKRITQYIRLLIFKYKQFTEFPAIAYIEGDKVKVEPLLIGADTFEFPLSEIEKAQEEKINDLDMSVIDGEFLSCLLSEEGKEFEDLLPEYPFDGSGMYRMQYVLECGMVVTEKSMEELRKLKGDV